MKVDFVGILRYLKNLVYMGDQLDRGAAVANIHKNVPFRGPNVFILAFAIIIASVGLNLNSTAVIIGAMLISPLMGPILGFGLGLGTNDTTLIKDALKNFAIMVTISILASTLYFLISPLQLTTQSELLARTNPTIYDVLIALFGGAAGMLENSRKEKGTVLSGVAIATALMPPLCTVGYGIATFDWHFISGALYLFIINSIFISLATFLMVKYLRFPSRVSDEDEAKKKKTTRIIAFIMILIIVPSIISAVDIVRQSNFDRSVQALVEKDKMVGRSFIYTYKTDHESKPATVELFVAGEALGESERERIYADAENLGIMRNQIFIQENAAVRNGLGLDNELMKGIYQHNAETIESLTAAVAKKDSIISAYAAKDIQAELLTLEICTQYENVASTVLARGSKMDARSGEGAETVVALLGCTSPLTDEQVAKLEKWLTIRLGVSSAKVLQTNYIPVVKPVAPISAPAEMGSAPADSVSKQ